MKQKIVLNEIVDYLHSIYPNVAFGIGGSIATNRFNKNSDVDILLLMEKFVNNFLVSFSYKGINISLMIFNKELLYKNEHKYLSNYQNMPITYLAGVNMIYDDKKMIVDYRNFIKRLFERRVFLNKLLVAESKKKIEILFHVEVFSIIDEKIRLYKIVNEIVSLFYLVRYADKIISKKEAHNPFNIIMKDDYELYVELKKCLPYFPGSYERLKKIYLNYILINY
ncbi:nucleotidyltransferase domain-containing protein [Phocaeicola sp.]